MIWESDIWYTFHIVTKGTPMKEGTAYKRGINWENSMIKILFICHGRIYRA